MTRTTLDITPSPRLLQVLGDIPLQPWQCLAELIDNSLDELLHEPFRAPENPLEIRISIVDEGASGTYLIVEDNGNGMTTPELERALRAGHSAKNRYGSLGLFGMGFNIATARLGNVTTVSTSTRGSEERIEARIDFADIQRRESFSIPIERSECPEEESGTKVRVHLKAQMAELFKSRATRETLMHQLGDVYSYLLRDSVPGISKDGYSSRAPARIYINDDLITPRLPCVWADTRTVPSYGQDVAAVQYIDLKLTEATACLDCGFWDRKNGPETCEECGGTNLDLRERRIWGWIGIQRFIDSKSYGIDFLRYGRKILIQDKAIFTYTDPDTLQSDAEYPIEMPANQGRIVGEIHLDHVPVTYQKNDFDRQSYDWAKAVEVVRGIGPLKPKGARAVNDSPLAKLYSAFRRNDPGLRYLTPGDGTRAIHAKAREWASSFHKGVARMRDDTEWFEAAKRHQQIKDGVAEVDSTEAGSGAGAGSQVDALLGIGSESKSGTLATAEKQPTQVTAVDMIEEARHLGTRRDDLSGTFTLGHGLGTWVISVFTTRADLKDGGGKSVASDARLVKGQEIEVFVAPEHRVFREFGRDTRDVALVHAASLIRDLKNSEVSPATLYAELVQEIKDLEVTAPSLVDRTERLSERLRTLMHPMVAEDSDSYWSLLTAIEKQSVEMTGAVQKPTVPLQDLVDDGSFTALCSLDVLGKFIEDRPRQFFDGVVFKPSLNRPQEAVDRIVGNIVRAIQNLASFQQDDLMRQRHDLQFAQLNLDFLDEQLTSEDRLA